MVESDTIAAIATPPGRGGIGVVRLSGPDLTRISQEILGRVPDARHAAFGKFRARDGAAIDRGIALYFRKPHSYTGEDVLELQGHGGTAVMQLLLGRCLELGARLAEPGEFTRRAFLNGKLDLAQAESVSDLIEASTAEAARGAMRSLEGELSLKVNEMSQALVDLRMLVEATLDFPEEEVDSLTAGNAAGRLREVRERLDRVLDTARQGSLLREGIQVVLVGRPNVGKSSLLNRLAGEEVAIVTDVPGTTRDAIRQAIQIAGVPLHVVDTAGLRDAADQVERIGIERTRAAIDKGDLALVMVDRSEGETDADRAILANLRPEMPRIKVHNKIDLSGEEARTETGAGGTEVWISARSGAGLDLLRAALLGAVGWHSPGEGVFMARARHLAALSEAAGHLEKAANETQRLELFAEELRLSQQALGAITGEFTADDLLGEIFSRFCIGK
jgi:tRNA modification GTPase